MDYIFRWMEIRFLSGTQLDLFAGLTPSTAPPAATRIPECRHRRQRPRANTIHLNPTEPTATDVTVTTPPQQVHITNGATPLRAPSTAVSSGAQSEAP